MSRPVPLRRSAAAAAARVAFARAVFPGRPPAEAARLRAAARAALAARARVSALLGSGDAAALAAARVRLRWASWACRRAAALAALRGVPS